MLLKFSSSLLIFMHGDNQQEFIQRRHFMHTINKSQSLVTAEDILRMIDEIQIGGYLEQKKIALGTLLLGLRLIIYPSNDSDGTTQQTSENSLVFERSTSLATQLMEPPKGMVIHGPAGSGKTRLMRSLVQLSGCDFIELPNSILLSK